MSDELLAGAIAVAECLYCDGDVPIEVDGARFDDRHSLMLEINAWCNDCIFNYHGDVPVEKVGGSLNYAMMEPADAE